MALAWHRLIRANAEAAAGEVERLGKQLFGEEEFGDTMAEAVMEV